MSEETQKREKLDLKLTFYIGLAFFTTGISWSLYNTQVNQALRGYGLLLSIVGILMALDNMLGVIIQPIMGSFSDSTRTRLGRRMPYILIGTISAAIFFALIPTGFDSQLWILILWMFLFGLSMGFYRSQAVALMPDFIRPYNRSKANAIINLMGGLGTLIATIISLLSNYIGLQLGFIIVSLLMLIALGVLLVKVKEKDAFSYQLILKAEQGGKGTIADIQPRIERPKLIESLKDIVTEKDKSTLFILLAIFAWFIAYQGAEGLFTVYAGPEGLNIVSSEGTAGFLLFFVAGPFILFALPAGIIAGKIGRRLTIKIGLVIILCAMVYSFIVGTNLILLLIGLVVFGIGWACVNINSIVIVWELAPSAEKIGTYTGVYYFFSVLAAILGPFFIGALMDLFGIASMFLNCGIFFLISLVLMFFVKRGEVELTEEEKIAKEKAMQRI
ncbi:MAG: MFS transporter [Promethearchaeati archaeon]